MIAKQSSTSAPVIRSAGYCLWKKKKKATETESEAKGRTEITMFRCGEVKWTREGTELRTQLSTDTRPPNLATLQPNLVKIFP